MGSQKVPGMVVLHCNGKTYGNTYLITFKVGPLFTQTLAPSILPLLEAPADASLGIFRSSPVAIRFYILHGCEPCPLGAHFQSSAQPEVTGSEVRRVRWLGDDRNSCTTSDVWLGALLWCSNHCPCLPLVAPLPPNCTTQPLQTLHVAMTSNTLSRRYELMVHHTVELKKSGNFLTAPRMFQQ
jgi:hypothetical protein